MSEPATRGSQAPVDYVTRPSNRLESPVLPPGLSDEDIVRQWLLVKATGRGRLSKTTLEQYRVEAERLFWYAAHIGTPISSWTLHTFSAFLEFLEKPPEWAIRDRGIARGKPEWRPFLGPLSERSAGQTQSIVVSLFDWLRNVGYLRINPGAGVPRVGRQHTQNQERFLSDDEFALMLEAIAARELKTTEARLLQSRDRFLIELFWRVGARTSEVVKAFMSDIKLVPIPASIRARTHAVPAYTWLFSIRHGKGNKPRQVPCSAIVPALQAYRTSFGLSPLPLPGEICALVMSVRRDKLGNRKVIQTRQGIYEIVKGICGEAYDYAIAHDRALDAGRLKTASTHWLRHSYAKGLVALDVDDRTAMANMGHADRRTFDQYVDDEAVKRALEMDNLDRLASL